MVNYFMAMLLGGSVFILLLVIALYAVYVIGLWKLFKKAGKQGWEAIIPFYNTYVLVEISGLNWWYFLIAISGTILGMLKINGLDYVANIATLVTRFFIFWNIAFLIFKHKMMASDDCFSSVYSCRNTMCHDIFNF